MEENNSRKSEIAVLAGGCFWCTEAIFLATPGIISATPGYSGDTIPNPTYELVSSGETKYVESIKIEFDSTKISFANILKIFFETHDPTSWNKQGNDVGSQYRSIVFYMNDIQESLAKDFIKKLDNSGAYDKPIVTEVRPFDVFYEAEDYHKRFYEKNKNSPYCELVIEPKLDKLQKVLKELEIK